MTNCFKKHWILIIGMLLLSNLSISQSFISFDSENPGVYKPNGRYFMVHLNPISSLAAECTSQTIKLDIGNLTYLPGSNGPLPQGVVINPVTDSNGLTILTITGIVNDGKQGSSLAFDVAMQFKPGTCDGVKQIITATTTNVGCNVASNQSGSIEAISLSPNNAIVEMNENYEKQPFCPRKIIKYTMHASNPLNQGFNIGKVKLRVEVEKCATVMGVYKNNTYASVNPVITSNGSVQIVEFDVPDIMLSIYGNTKSYDIYIVYPCLNGNNSDCTTGRKYISVSMTGEKMGCGIPFETEKVTKSHLISTESATCGNVNCIPGGDVGEIEKIALYNSSGTFACPVACLNAWDRAVVRLSIPPFNPNFTNRVATVDIPNGIIISTAFVNEANSCGTPYIINYIDAQGNKQSRPFSGTLTRKIEFITDCIISTPQSQFCIDFNYDPVSPPASGSYLGFYFTYTSNGAKVIEGAYGATIEQCFSNALLVKQVRKASQKVFENNYNASAIPGELMIYRQEIYNLGTGDNNNVTIDKIDPNLVYAGGFKYAYQQGTINDPKVFTPLLGKNSFTLPELGTVNVSVPAIGESGTVTLSGFNFPCTVKKLFIEYNVIVKNNVIAGTKIPNFATLTGSSRPSVTPTNNITIAAFTYVKNKMFVKCSLANEWNESGINVKNEEVVDFKMQFSNAGSTPVVLSELLNLKPQLGDLYELGSNPRKSTFNVNYYCDSPEVFVNGVLTQGVSFEYALNSPTMDRSMLCPESTSGNSPNWISTCDNANWFKVNFPNNFRILPGDYVDVIYKGKISGAVGTAYNSFAFSAADCSILSANSNTLVLTNDNTGIGCNSCTLTNPYSGDMKNLFVNLLKNILTRKINGETDSQINGSSPEELIALMPYIKNGGGNKIYNFSSTMNAENKITTIKFSFTANSENDVTFLEEKGLDYNPEVGAINPSYLNIDLTLFDSTNQDQYFTTCRKTLDDHGTVVSDCNSKTQVKNIDFCPTRFCHPMNGEIKTGE
ncbi:hypothetical protein [Flavobacterium fluviale]|uniref:Uncharacterized protein n=1 Tax=Flavobacterium fluviale TaxID=2249356 RepID=A0A344LSH3_9FLAO|nr:hypothetical protein [Flavobacterium fluviale]AXB56865.1 hypothetical protein HYN86_09785 [Flavobacterium fluviale]